MAIDIPTILGNNRSEHTRHIAEIKANVAARRIKIAKARFEVELKRRALNSMDTSTASQTQIRDMRYKVYDAEFLVDQEVTDLNAYLLELPEQEAMEAGVKAYVDIAYNGPLLSFVNEPEGKLPKSNDEAARADSVATAVSQFHRQRMLMEDALNAVETSKALQNKIDAYEALLSTLNKKLDFLSLFEFSKKREVNARILECERHLRKLRDKHERLKPLTEKLDKLTDAYQRTRKLLYASQSAEESNFDQHPYQTMEG